MKKWKWTWTFLLGLGLVVAAPACVAENGDESLEDEAGLADGSPAEKEAQSEGVRCTLSRQCPGEQMCLDCECVDCPPPPFWCHKIDMPTESCFAGE